MNKKLLTAMLIGAVTMVISTSVSAEPCKGPCAVPPPNAEGKPCPPPEMQKPQIGPECEEAREAKKAEFDKRMNLTEAQKAKLEKIKADEKKLLEPIHKKMAKKHEEMKALTKKEIDIRTESMKKFEAILSPDQTAELDKMKSEIHDKMQKDFEHKRPGPRHMMRPQPQPNTGCQEPSKPQMECSGPCKLNPKD